jgi:F0F1-type ATP synthase assembly protein I
MVDDQPTPRPGPDDAPVDAGQGWTAIAYLITGILVWGVIGWLVDQWLDSGGVATAVGTVVGAAGGVYLIARRLGA